MFKFTTKEIEEMEKTVDLLETDNRDNPWISAGGIIIREIELNGYKWDVKFEVEVIPEEEYED
jgi:hypothetical protein